MKYKVARREAERCFMLTVEKIKSEMGGKHLIWGKSTRDTNKHKN